MCAGRCGTAPWWPLNSIVRRHVNEPGFVEFLRYCFNGLAIFTLITLLGAAVGGGDWASTGITFLFVLASYPTGALAFTVVSESFLEGIQNPYYRAFLMWAPFYVLGWLQWAILFPGLRSLMRQTIRRIRAV